MRSWITMLVLAVSAIVASAVQPGTAVGQSRHVVRAGQTMAAIARRYRVSVSDLAAANRKRPADPIRVGEVLQVPSRGVVYVRPGDTLHRIARRHDCSVDALARANRLRDRASLRVGQRLLLPGHSAVAAAGGVNRDWGEPEIAGRVRLRGRTTEMRIQLVDSEGRVLSDGLRRLAEAMRRDEEDPLAPPDPRLAALVALISDHFGGRALVIVSGWRDVRGHTSEGSRHVSGNALDIRVEGVPHRAVWDFCRSLQGTGCGLYPNSTFVHVDTRDSNAQWVDWSGPGQRPRYGTLRGPHRGRARHGRRSRPRPSVGRHVTRPDALPEVVELTEG